MPSSSMFDQWTQSQRVSLAPFLELNSITTRLCGELTRQNLKVINSLAQASQDQLQALASARGVNDVLQCQSQWMEEAVPQALGHAEQWLDTMLESASEYRDWFETNMEAMKQQGRAASAPARRERE